MLQLKLFDIWCSLSVQVVVERSQAEALAAAAAAGDNLICQAIINSGIALGTEETVVEEGSQEAEEINKEVSDCPDVDEGITEIQIKEEFVEMETVVGVRASRTDKLNLSNLGRTITPKCFLSRLI